MRGMKGQAAVRTYVRMSTDLEAVRTCGVCVSMYLCACMFICMCTWHKRTRRRVHARCAGIRQLLCNRANTANGTALPQALLLLLLLLLQHHCCKYPRFCERISSEPLLTVNPSKLCRHCAHQHKPPHWHCDSVHKAHFCTYTSSLQPTPIRLSPMLCASRFSRSHLTGCKGRSPQAGPLRRLQQRRSEQQSCECVHGGATHSSRLVKDPAPHRAGRGCSWMRPWQAVQLDALQAASPQV